MQERKNAADLEIISKRSIFEMRTTFAVGRTGLSEITVLREYAGAETPKFWR